MFDYKRNHYLSEADFFLIREVHKGHQHSAYRFKALNAVKNVSVTGSIIYLEMIHRKNVLKRIKKVQVLHR